MQTKDIQKIEEDVDDTLESEKRYKEYIQNKNQKRSSNSCSLNHEYNIGRYEAKVEKIVFSEHNEQFTLHITDYQGKTKEFDLNAGYPENKSSEWVKLCEWKDVNPRRPSKLHNKQVPIVREGSDFKISVPPVQKRLNPIKYKYSRSKMKLIKYLENESNFQIWKELSTFLITTLISIIMLSILTALLDQFISIKQITSVYDVVLLTGYPILLTFNIFVNIFNVVYFFVFIKIIITPVKSKIINYLFPDQ